MKKLLLLILLLYPFSAQAQLLSGYIEMDTENSPYSVSQVSDGQNECVIVQTAGTTATFKTIATSATTRFQIIYGTSAASLSSTSANTSNTAAAQGDVLTLTITGLIAGQKYFYKAQYSTGGAYTVITPSDYATFPRYFRIPPSSTSSTYSFRFIVISDAHINMYTAGGFWNKASKFKLENRTGATSVGFDEDWNFVALDMQGEPCTVPEVCRTYGLSAGIKNLQPDFVLFTGDDIQLESINTWVQNNDTTNANKLAKATYQSFMLAVADLGIPAYYTVGNHEQDFKANWTNACSLDVPCSGGLTCDWAGNCPCTTESEATCAAMIAKLDAYTGFSTYRTDTLIFPAAPGSVAGNYDYVDWGKARIFSLDPYAFKTTTSQTDKDCQYSLGFTQANWFNQNVRLFNGQWVFATIHQGLNQKLTSGYTSYTYGWGGVTDGTTVYAGQGCNAWQLYEPLRNSVADKFLLLGHSHTYAKEQYKNMYVYSLPAPFRDNGLTPKAYYYAAGTTAAGNGNTTPPGIAAMVFDVTQYGVTVWGMNPDGSRHTSVPIDTYTNRAMILP